MSISEEQLIRTYMKTLGITATAQALGMTKQNVQGQIDRMRFSGVNLPPTKTTQGRYHKYNSKKVEALNELIQKIKESNT